MRARRQAWCVVAVVAVSCGPDARPMQRSWSETGRSNSSSFLGVPGFTQVKVSKEYVDWSGTSMMSEVEVFRGGQRVCTITASHSRFGKGGSNWSMAADIALVSPRPLLFDVSTLDSNGNNDTNNVETTIIDGNVVVLGHEDSVPSKERCVRYELREKGSCRELLERTCTQDQNCKLTHAIEFRRGTGRLVGVAKRNQRPLGMVKIDFGQAHQTVLTDAQGAFALVLDPGGYALSIQLASGRRFTVEDVRMQPSMDTFIVISLNNCTCCSL